MVSVDDHIYLIGCSGWRYGIYSPATDSWQTVTDEAGPLNTPHDAVALNGSIFAPGGSAYILDTVTSSWSKVAVEPGAGASFIAATDSRLVALELNGLLGGYTVYVHDPGAAGWVKGEFVEGSDGVDALNGAMASGSKAFVLVGVVRSAEIQ